MARIIEMPKLSDTMEEGGIASWLVKEGDKIDIAEPLAEIETDKATMEYGSPEEGTILKLLVKPGESCELGAAIAVVGSPGESFDLDALLAGTGKSDGATGATEAAADSGVGTPKSASEGLGLPQASAAAGHSQDGRVKSSPLARKMAKDKGVVLEDIKGSGPGGRIIMRDVAGATTTGGGAAAASHGGEGREATSREPAALAPAANGEKVPLTMMRKTIAKRLLAGKNDAPHFYLTVSANMIKLLAWRQELNSAANDPVAKVSVNDLLVLAAARALRQHPDVNASWQGDHIFRHHEVHMAVAVALPGGLVTPVIQKAHVLGVREIARTAKELVGRAKDGALAPEDYQGGTFTISNLGMMGIEEFTAIINPPQAAILAVGATIPTPWVDGNGAVVVQPRMKMTLSCDHRVVDGAMGAEFLKTLVAFIEDPLNILS